LTDQLPFDTVPFDMFGMPIPNCCIWCHNESPEATFDVSHVLPECVGNENQQTLPHGIVCKKCNNYFGTKIEPALLEDPLFHIIAVALRLKDPQDMNEFRDQIFDSKHPPVGSVERNLHCDIEISPKNMKLNVRYCIKGGIVKTYQKRELALLSRALHKIAFENLAWAMINKRIQENIDILDPRFEPVRKWSRYGEPTNHIRPVVRMLTTDVKPQWEFRLWKFGGDIGAELNLFGDWYAVSLTSSHAKAQDDLKQWVGSSRSNYHIWCIGEDLSLIKPSRNKCIKIARETWRKLTKAWDV